MMKNKTKKLLSLLLAVSLLLGAAPLMALELKLPDLSGLFSWAQTLAPKAKASDYLTSGYCGDTSNGKDGKDIVWTLDEDGVLTLTGTGPMGSTPNKADNRVKKLIVGEGITSIAQGAFTNCQNLEEIALPSTMNVIYRYAFENDTSLNSIDFGGTQEIRDNAFYGCNALVSLEFPSSVRIIGSYAFGGCQLIQSLVFHEGLLEIGGSAFYQCLQSPISIEFPDTLEVIGGNAFGNCYGLRSIHLGSGIKEIGYSAFSHCKNLEGEIVFPDCCETVDYDAFTETKITSLTFGAGLTSYHSSRMYYLQSIDVSDENTVYAAYDNVLYTKGFTKLIQVPKRETLNIPAEFPLQNGNFLRNIPVSKVNIDPDNPYYQSIDGIVYSKDGKQLIACPQAWDLDTTGRDVEVIINAGTEVIGENAFAGCGFLNIVDIPGSVETIKKGAFASCYRLKEVTFHEGLKHIEQYAFQSCIHDILSEWPLSFPDSLETIEEQAFYNCDKISSVSFGSGLKTIGQQAFAYCKQLSGDIVLPEGCVSVGAEAFTNTKITSFSIGSAMLSFEPSYKMSELESVTVSAANEVYTSVDGVMFTKDCANLIQVPVKDCLYLPAGFALQTNNFLKQWEYIASVQVDEENLYYQSIDGIVYTKDGSVLVACPKQKQGEVNVLEGTNTVGQEAFSGCTLISSVSLPPSVESLEVRAFTCPSLSNVVFSEGLKTIKQNAFAGCFQNTTGVCLTLPDSLETLESYAFGSCTGLETVVFGKSIQTVDKYAFWGCTNLKNIYLSPSQQSMDLTSCALPSLMLLVIPNPYTKLIGYGNVTPSSSGGTIRGYCGSTAHEMAVKRLFAFESIGHSFLDWYTVTPATFESEGLERRDCAYCDGYEERVIPKLEQETYTATFMADGRVVGYVDFPKGATVIDNAPAVPAKDRYTGRWEDYTLADADITINAVYTLIQSGDASELETDSTATLYAEKDNVLFRMSAWSAAKTVKSVVSQAVPLDIVLVVDQSGSMDETLGGSVKKVDALKAAAHEFIDAVAENAALTGADHRIAIAGFGLAGHYSGYQTNENTELLTSSRGIVPFAEITPADYGAALLSISDRNALDDAVDAIEARGATAADLGLEMAKGIFSNTDSEGRDRIVVFMTDGAPTYQSSFQSAVANSAVANARLLKTAYGALVYSVGVFSDADARNLNIRKFMQAVSSNYPKARSYTNPGTAEADSFFTTVRHTDALSGVFRTITTESLSHTATFDNVTLIKTLSRYVTLTAPQEQTLRINAMRQYGIADDQITVTRNADGTTTIRLDGLTPYEAEKDGEIYYEVSLEFFASLNENAAAAGIYTVDDEDSGVMLNGAVGYEATFATSDITLSAAKTRYLFTINGELYEIAEGSTVSAAVPETDFSADWLFSGWNTAGVNSVNGVILDATLVKAPRTVVWHTADCDVTHHYTEGALITPPEVADRADGSIFLSWNKSLPTVMPDADLEFTAVYGEHVHQYISVTETPVTCTENGLTRFTCACGDTYTQTVEAIGHDYEAITPSTEQDASRCTFVCNNCGQRYEYALDYQVTVVMNGGKNVSFEFALTDDDLNVGFEPEGSVAIAIPLSEFQTTAHSVHVTRTVNGRKERVPAKLEDGFVVISADHFTPYEIDFVFACEESGEHDWGEGRITKEPTCKEEGVRHFVCAVCLDEKDEPIPVDEENHADYGTEVVNAVAAACYRDGYTGDTVCKGCGHVFTQGEVISKTTVAHAWDEGTVTLKPTCQTPGTVLYRCTVKSCGATEEREMPVDPDAHVYSVTVTEPTCTEGGYTSYACTLCRYGYSADETEPLGHIYGIRITPPTCTTEGITTCTCTRCRDSFTKDPTPVADHVDNDGDGWCDFGCGTAVEPAEQESNCVCGQYHTGPLSGLIIFFHKLVYFFRNLFGKRDV